MARIYTTTITVKCWKAHTCDGCGGVYAYQLIRAVQGKSGDADGSRRAAERAARAAVASEVDVQPCPICGLVQPDMIGQRLARHAKWTGLAALGVFGLLLVVASGSHTIHAHSVTPVFVVLSAAAALGLLFTQLGHPNADLAKNLRVARARVSSGDLRAHKPGTSAGRAAALARPRSWVAQAICTLLLLAAPAAAASPEIVRSLHGWPLNDDWFPAIVGTGDRARVQMRGHVSSIAGHWRGQSSVSMAVDGDHPALTLRSYENASGWTPTIRAKQSESSSFVTPSIDVFIPPDESLAGQRGTIDVSLDVEYPAQVVYSQTYSVRTEHMHDTFPIHLASEPGAGAAYMTAWWNGTLLASALTLLGALGLFVAGRWLQRRATPTRVYR